MSRKQNDLILDTIAEKLRTKEPLSSMEQDIRSSFFSANKFQELKNDRGDDSAKDENLIPEEK